jgi:hypothetical protein
LIAQQVAQVFPNLVSKTAPTPLTPDGTYSVNFNGLYGPIIKSIQEMNLQVTDISDLTKTNTWRDSLVAWLGNAGNGIQKFVTDEVLAKKVTTDTLCVGQVCVTQDQFLQMVQHDTNSTPSAPTVAPSVPDTTTPPASDSTSDTTPPPADTSTSPSTPDPTTTTTPDPTPSVDSTTAQTPPSTDPSTSAATTPAPDPAPVATQ